MNYYDKTFDLESLNGKSKGYALAKKLNLAGKISLLYVVAYLFICLFYVKRRFSYLIICESYFTAASILSALLFYLGIVFTLILIAKRRGEHFDVQEKIFYNLYVIRKLPFYGKRKNNCVLVLAKLEAEKGDKEMCRNVLALGKEKYLQRNKNYKLIKSWVEYGTEPLDSSLLQFNQLPVNILIILALFVTAIGVFFSIGFDEELLLEYGLSKLLVSTNNILVAISLSIEYTFIFSYLITRKQERVIKIVVTIVLFIVFGFVSSYIFVTDFRNAVSDDTVDEEYEEPEEYYDYSYTDNDGDFYSNASGEEMIDVENHMISLGNYLLDHGVIDYFTYVDMSYSAKGTVRGTISRDDNYEYILYDNGRKDDEIGNDCIEFVLEAEPLDENGNSLGQMDAVIKEFYLVDMETFEVTDEHKTTW